MSGAGLAASPWSAYVLGFNGADHTVGYFDGAPWASVAPLGDANTLLPANSGWQIVNVSAMTDRLQIVGQGYHAGSGTAARAFVLEPTR